MKIKTTKVGFINGSLVEPGTEMEIPDKAFSKNWMESMEPAKAAKPVKVERISDPDQAI